MSGYKSAKDRQGAYNVDWSRMQDMAPAHMAPDRIERIPFCQGNARVLSVPAHEAMLAGVGRDERLTHAVFALRVGDGAVHQALSPAGMRQFADRLYAVADLIEGGAK